MFRLTLAVIAMSFSIKDSRADSVGIAEAFAALGFAELVGFLDDKSLLQIKNYRYGRGQNAVHAAVVNTTNPEAIRLAYEAGADINHQDRDGRTPLHHTIDANFYLAARLLMELGARTDIPNEAGFTAASFCQVVLKSEPNHKSCRIVSQM